MTAIALALVAFFASAASAAFAAVQNPDTFIYAIVGDADSLDPAWQYDAVSFSVVIQPYEPLIFYQGSSLDRFDPILAREVPSPQNGLISKDGRVYTFPIRKNVKFHDGSPLTPEDVKYSLMRFMLQDRAGGPSSLLLEPFLGISGTRDEEGRIIESVYKDLDQAIEADGEKVRLHLKTPFAPILSILAGWGSIVSKKWAAQHGDWDGTEAAWKKYNNPRKESSWFFEHMNGTGPFLFERWDKENKKIYLSRNENYWRKKARLKNLIFQTVDEFSTRKLLLQGGGADAIFLERQYQPQVQTIPGVALQDDLPMLEITNAFIFNFKINPVGNPNVGSGKLDGRGIPPDFFSDPDLRKAFAYAFDYEGYIRDGYRGKGTQAKGPIPKGVPGYNPNQGVYKRDQAKAVEYFKKAHGGKVWEKGFRLTLSFMQGRADRQLACQILKKNVEDLNSKFQIDVRPIQWSTYLAHFQQGKLPLVNGRWGLDYPDSHNCAFPFLHSQGHYPAVQKYSNPKADALIEKAVRELDPKKRRALYFELQKIAHEDVPQIYTVDAANLRAHRKWVKGWYYHPIFPHGYFYQVYKEENPPGETR